MTRSMKDPENATARPTRASALRAKSIADTVEKSTTVMTRSTAALKAKAAGSSNGEGEANVGKRKREALAEVATGGNKAKGGASGAKGKEKEVVAVKAKAAVTTTATTTTTTTTTRILRRGTSVAASGTVKASKTKVTEKSEVKKTTTRRAASKPPSTATTRVFIDPPQLETSKPKETAKRKETDDGETRRAVKRRLMDAIVEEVPAPEPEEPKEESKDQSQIDADKIATELAKVEPESSFAPEPEEQDWDDLDADDWDDPLMVSEYVVDVCKYWKELEVCAIFLSPLNTFDSTFGRSPPSPEQITWTRKNT